MYDATDVSGRLLQQITKPANDNLFKSYHLYEQLRKYILMPNTSVIVGDIENIEASAARQLEHMKSIHQT